MNRNEHIKNSKLDVRKWIELIKVETKVFERRLQAKSTMTDPADIREINRKINESDKALQKLAKGKMLAEIRLMRAQNGDLS